VDIETLTTSAALVAYVVDAAVTMSQFAAWGVVLPVAVGLGVGVGRAGRTARYAALRRVLWRGAPEGWLRHLAAPGYAWASPAAFAITTLVLFASVAWTLNGIVH
jgi:hypothetical protein